MPTSMFKYITVKETSIIKSDQPWHIYFLSHKILDDNKIFDDFGS